MNLRRMWTRRRLLGAAAAAGALGATAPIQAAFANDDDGTATATEAETETVAATAPRVLVTVFTSRIESITLTSYVVPVGIGVSGSDIAGFSIDRDVRIPTSLDPDGAKARLLTKAREQAMNKLAARGETVTADEIMVLLFGSAIDGKLIGDTMSL